MNESDIKLWYRMLRHEKQSELRAIKKLENGENDLKTHHFFGEDKLIELVKQYEGEYNIYIGVNERCEKGTTAKDVIKVKVIPVDVDCINKPASDEDIAFANQVTTQIVTDAERQGFKVPMVSFSGNGFQIYFAIPEIVLDEKNRTEVEDKIQEFERRLIEKYSNDKIRLDQVGDLPRIMRVAGTYNLKSKTTSKLFTSDFQEDFRLREFLLDMKPESKMNTGGLTQDLKDKIKNDEIVQKMMEGDLCGKASRSEAEMSLVCRLVQLGLDKEQIFRTMGSCKIGKWQEANIGYRNITYRKAIEIISKENLKLTRNPKLSELYTVYKNWLYLEDTKRIDIVLAAYLTQYMEGTPIWLIMVGNSGDGKTEQMMALKTCANFQLLHSITSKTLVSGIKDVKDLAPDLNGKVVVIPDMAQILQLSPQDKAEVWAQLRDLYDGFAGKMSGSGKRSQYSGLRITLLGCSTPKIDSQILVHQDLGTRELIYRTEDIQDEFTLMEMAMRNEEFEEQMKKELTEITFNFLKDKRVIHRALEPDEEAELQNLAMFTAQARATAEYDSYTDELRNFVYPERPTRIVKQFKRIYLALLSLEDGYSKERAFEILWHLAKSCAFPVRISIFEHFIREFITLNYTQEYNTSTIANKLFIGKRTAKRELSILWNMGIVSKTEREEGNRWQLTEYWKLNLTNKFIESYLKFIKSSVNKVV